MSIADVFLLIRKLTDQLRTNSFRSKTCRGFGSNPLFLYSTLRFFLSIAIVLSVLFQVHGQHFTPTRSYYSVYSKLLNLEFDEANQLLNTEKGLAPDNLSWLYLEDLGDFLFIVVTEEQAEFERRKDYRSNRLKQLKQLPDSSPYKLLAIGETHLHWAFSMMRFGEYLNGAREINKAFHALEKNMELHPEFLPTYKSMGLLHTLIGTVPDNYKWATRLMGVDGTIEQGIAEMEMVVKKSDLKPEHSNLRKETLFLLSFLHINLLNDAAAIERYQSYLEPESGPLMDFAKASILKKSGHADKAIEILEHSVKSKPSAFPYLHYLLGELKLARLDKDADLYLNSYLDSFKGNSYVKSAHQKLAWSELLINKDQTKYRLALYKIDGVGNAMLDEDKTAQEEFESGKIPNTVLLKARLQFDAGYFQQGLNTLINSDKNAITTKDEELEFTYRLGRIHHELQNLDKAIGYYKMTIENGKDSKRYFAANSSLQLGLIYELQGNSDSALAAYRACSEFSNSEYRNSINQKAKAGIGRLKN